MAETTERWQDFRQACGHLFNWSEEMTEWTHQASQSPDFQSLTKAGIPFWYHVPIAMACTATDYLNALEEAAAALDDAVSFWIDEDEDDWDWGESVSGSVTVDFPATKARAIWLALARLKALRDA